MKALSLTQPWPWIIIHLGKRIENRSRNIGNHRGPLLLHASKRMTSENWWSAYRFVKERVGVDAASSIPPQDHPGLVRGAICGRCEIVAQARPCELVSALSATDILTFASWSSAPAPDLEEQTKRWYMGQHAYLLANVEPTPIVPCKGALGFWNVPLSILERALPLNTSLGCLDEPSSLDLFSGR